MHYTPNPTHRCLGLGEVIDLQVKVFDLHLHGLAGLDGGRTRELRLLQLQGHGSVPSLGMGTPHVPQGLWLWGGSVCSPGS